MAEVFHRVESGPYKGRKTHRAVVAAQEVVDGVDRVAKSVATDARRILRSTAGHPGHNNPADNSPAEISVEPAVNEASGRRRGRYANIDKFVVLSDERGMGAAMTIEYGQSPGIDDRGNFYPGTEAVAPLRKAAGIAIAAKGGVHRRRYNRRSRKISWNEGWG